MKCTEIQDLLSAYYDNELSIELRTNVDAHIEECAECTAELATFKTLSSMVANLDQPETPASVWSAVERGLDQQHLESGQIEKVTPASAVNGGYFGNRILQLAAGIAAIILVGFIGWTLWYGHHERQEMVNAMDRVATEIDSKNVTTLLLNKFGGSPVSYQEAITQVGFRPIATRGLPKGYSVDSIQVLDMPCCKCTQTACRRLDNTRFFIYEHDNAEPGWFANRKKRQCECGGTTCRVVDLDDRLAATWKKGDRHITLLGVRDEKEIDLLVSHFEKNL